MARKQDHELGLTKKGHVKTIEEKVEAPQCGPFGPIGQTMPILQMKLQTTTSTTLIDLQKVAARIEERIYKIAIDFVRCNTSALLLIC
uniref:Uncharacterized protein n=1 Tax=Oryza sativa subsp. japonica TaxID=39947 RepID=Q8GVV2_ORYSJ|nr:hypothetical protein [Oryza sativa Japonica Group]